MRPFVFVLIVGAFATAPVAAQLPGDPPVVQPDEKMPAPQQFDPAFPVTPNWQPPPNWGGVQPALVNPVQATADQAERTLWTWIISSTVGALAIFAGVAVRFIVRARANGDFSDDPWIKAQLEGGGKRPG